ncbi:MAG TPA: cell division protein FtsL [Casimicrobiaceae bacterium]|jgi:cell division protein FtsL|nr:cell division protein FtsL [Casimicrobiaceae bacterium]
MTRTCMALLAVLVLCALSLVTSRHQARRAFVELERQQARAHQYDVEYGQLSLEESTWGMPARVAQIARDNLHMELPTPSRVEVVDLPGAQ